MSDFQRSPSRVWWPEEYPNLSRNFSASPGSQDSGFSDTENSPPGVLEQADPNCSTPRRESPRQCLPKDILKNINEEDSSKSQNLTINFKPKSTPTKSIVFTLSDKKSKSAYNFVRTPTISNLYEGKAESEPIKKSRFHRNGSLKVSRSLFNNISKQSVENMPVPDQYSEEDHVATELHNSNTNSEVEHDDSRSDEYSIELEGVKTCPTIAYNDASLNISSRQNLSAPAILPFEEERRTISSIHNDSLGSSDCESELESTFHGLLDHPKHTSTPKVSARNFRTMKLHRSKRISKLYGPSEEERNLVSSFTEETASVQKWLKEVGELYEPECMTTLQCKSIAAELNQNVALIASRMTSTLRKLLRDSDVIFAEMDNIQQQTQHTAPLAQSLARLIEEFIENYVVDPDVDILKICNDVRNVHNAENFSELIIQLDSKWKTLQNKVLLQEIKHLVNELVDPHSEMHVRAALTGLTSIALRNKIANDTFISCNTIQILCILCEKCESSTVRSLILRALSTICTSSIAVRHLENASGVTILTDVIFEESRPEPERSEAVALLAQITAPWIEDNRCVKGLQYHIKILVKALTQFITNTKCCQNLLLCTAALANLTEMEPKSIKYILSHNSIGVILQAIKTRNALVSIHVLEQVAILIATLSSKANARKQLTDEHAPAALLHFLHCNHADPEVESRLQQKSVIALSRLSSEPEAAEQIVKLNGVTKLVKLCRERKERHDSDAVLVAALATLRKIAEACGNDVIDSLDVQELIEPRLLDSFLAYSAQSESYV